LINDDIPIEINIRTAGTPKANGKQESWPKHCTDFLSSGVMNVDSNAPTFTEK